MLKNYIKIAWRSLKRQPFFTFLNVFGLAIGIAGGLLISLYIYDELSFDKMFADSDRIYRVNADIKFGGMAEKYAVTPHPLGPTIKKDFPQIEEITRFRIWGSMLLRKPDTEKNVKEGKSTYVDASFFDMFGLHLLEGDVATALKEPNTLVLSKTAAEKHFGDNNAVGERIILNNNETYTVTGVIADFPKNSFLNDMGVLMAMSGSEEIKEDEWTGNNFNTFFKLMPQATIENFQEPLQSIVGKYLIPYVRQNFDPGASLESLKADGNYVKYSSVALKDIHLSGNRVAEISHNSDIQTIYILTFIGFFLILLASVNFMNLSTAHSLKRAKEVGVRKTLGSNKTDLVRQFLTESGLIAFISLLLALVVALVTTPYFNQLSGKEITIPFSNPIFWIVLLIATAVLGLISGSYPAFFMSRFIPSEVLKGGGQNSVGGSKIRNSLVVFQFAISVFLIVSTLVVFHQLKYIQSKDLGFTKEQILIIEDAYAAGNRLESFKNDVKNIAQVENATLSSYLPTPSNRSDYGYDILDVPKEEKSIRMQRWRVDQDYIATLGLKIIAGRNFDWQQFKTDSTAIILNETATTKMNSTPQEAIGKRLMLGDANSEEEAFTVIGVVKDFHYASLKNDIGALNLQLGNRPNTLAVKLKAGDFTQTLVQIEQKWNKAASGQPFNFYFMDDSFNSTYEAEWRLGNIFLTFTILSILIACLGLFGLAAFNAQKRTKEIGVRKVLGASISQITYKLTADFLKLVGIAVLISLPIGWYSMNRWLEDFSYRIEISWWIFALAGILAVTIAILTVSYQSIKAAMANPVKSLRTE
jgi:putative ABC transport system permease protein